MTLLNHELEIATEVVQRSGAIALEIQAGGDDSLQTSDKANDQGPVTRADLAVEALIVAALRTSFPNDAILAEESASASQWRQHARVWMIDPVDGTKDFASGDTSWAIHVGLVIDGHPALGIVHEPGHDRLSWAIDHLDQRHAWCRHDTEGRVEALHGIGRCEQQWRLVTSKSHRSERLDAIMALLGITPEQTLRTASTGVKICMVARGVAEFYAHPTVGTKLWDSAAPQAILHAAGGRLTDMRGAPLNYAGPVLGNDLGLLASGPGVDHDALVDRLRPLADTWFCR
ncbi:3'(2'),5'-bisphosphate nucleotidase CysQ family protein [Enhygromyxa salina]|uniref:3'(2'),5-bisphosphonucleoside 3'(2')-phosphohydrolase n=1 Tax=Enhygromyxa salina TaxID=215803 RepID=A0A2S9Y393_9BACT|nr:3'(2'),5'-bisphosphate nucleotidase CysQ [Enhygromyxa salina]PRP99574.1 3'(2'),5'-bisphosphate nucleotidase CysQ [Enhygromyxa salina]